MDYFTDTIRSWPDWLKEEMDTEDSGDFYSSLWARPPVEPAMVLAARNLQARGLDLRIMSEGKHCIMNDVRQVYINGNLVGELEEEDLESWYSGYDVNDRDSVQALADKIRATIEDML